MFVRIIILNVVPTGARKKASVPLELKLQTVVSLHVVLGIEPQTSIEE